MAIARQEHHLGRGSRPDRNSGHIEPETAEHRVKNEQKGRSVSSRISLVLASMMLGAAAGWMIFRAVLTLITLD